MSNIVFCFPPITSTLNSSLKLARELKSCGHQITYLGIKDCEPVVLANGFNFSCIYESWFPSGWFDDCYQKAQSPDNQDFIPAKNLLLQFNSFVDYLMAGGDAEFKIALEKTKANLVIISTSSIESLFMALIIHKMKLKSIYLFDVLGGIATHKIPPVHTELVADGSLWASIKTRWSWQRYNIEKKITEYYLCKNGIDLFTAKKIKKFAQYCDYPYQLIEHLTDMPCPQLRLSELILFPEIFEFPNAKRLRRYYAEASIDLNRVQVSFPWEKLHDSRPMVYVALGTLFMLKKSDYEKFFRIVIDASTQWSEWDWVISIGNNLSVDDFSFAPDNVVIVNRAPQLDILKKASLMITHGGPNSIKECIYFGVPMIVYPLWFDQAGNVARVTYHHIGLKGDFKTITTQNLQDLITQISTDPSYRENIKLMQTSFRELEERKPSVQIIERLINE